MLWAAHPKIITFSKPNFPQKKICTLMTKKLGISCTLLWGVISFRNCPLSSATSASTSEGLQNQKNSESHSLDHPAFFPMDKAQFLLIGLPLFLFFSDIINLFTPLPPKPPPHHHHQQPQPKPQSAPLDFPTQVCSPWYPFFYSPYLCKWVFD